jgi:RHS repeat-associated protein
MSSAAHYHADGNGNVTMLVGTGAPTIKAYYKYEPLGRTLGSSGSLGGGNAMRFSSKPVMGSSELYYYGYRFYDPSSQRWLNRDPIGEKGEAEHILLSGECSIERSRSSWFECVYS